MPNRENASQDNEIRYIENRNGSNRQEGLSESIKILSYEMSAKFSQDLDLLMDLMQSQINRAISSAIIDRVIPEIQNFIGEFAFGPEWSRAKNALN